MNLTVPFLGADFEVEYDIDYGCPATHDTPETPPTIEIIEIYLPHSRTDLTDFFLNAKLMTAFEEAIWETLKQYDDA